MTFINEKVIEIIKCKHCDTKFEITDKDIEFYEKVSPIFAWKKYNIPSPTLCPDCRQQRRLSFRNERNLYRRKCDFTWKDIVSIYSPDKPYKVYDREIWLSDKWNPLDYWIDFDFSKSFFKQFQDLLYKVPRQNLNIDNTCENSSYSNQLTNCKDCYLCFSWSTSEKCSYSNRVNFCENWYDCLLIKNSQECYECIDCFNIFNCKFSQKIINCQNSSFLFNCIWCEYCFWCVNLVNKRYHIFNKEYSKETYFEEIKKHNFSEWNIKSIKKYFIDFLNNFPKKFANINNTENSNWDNIYNAKNSVNVFDCTNIENSKYCYFLDDSSDCMDINYWCDNTTLHYEVSTWWVNATKVIFSIDTWPEVNNLIYCDSCSYWVSNCFGCIWLRNKSYCIFNKQYTKEEYETLVPKIIEHMIEEWDPTSPRFRGTWWWEFFPSNISPFWYNETVAMEYFPIPHPSPLLWEERGQAQVPPLTRGRLGWGFNWSNYEAPFPKVEKVINASMLPENIADIPDDILNWAIECEVTQKPFRIIGQELEFYRKHNLPIPKRHPDQRHLDRMTLRNPRKLYDRKCDKCGVDMKTTYSPERPEIVYCQTCYNKEVY